MAYTQSRHRRNIYVEDPDRPGVFLDLGLSKAFSGGAVAGETGSTTLGDGTQVILTGDPMRENATAKMHYDEKLHAVWDKIERGVQLSRVRITDVPIDDRRVGWTDPRTLTGKLVKAAPPDSESGSTSASEAELEFALDVRAAA